MSIQNLNKIIQNRESQFGGMFNDTTNQNLDLDVIKDAIKTLADNQKKIYEKLEEIDQKISN